MCITDKKLVNLQEYQKTIVDLMLSIKDDCSEYNEYKTIIMNLTTVSKELNSITLKYITGTPLQTEELETT